MQYFGSETVSILCLHAYNLPTHLIVAENPLSNSLILHVQVEDRFFIYLEYVHPGSINKYIRDHCGGTMTESVVRNFTRHILSGLAYLHNKKTVHR